MTTKRGRQQYSELMQEYIEYLKASEDGGTSYPEWLEKRIAELEGAWEKAKAVPLVCVYSEDGRYNYPEKMRILAAAFDKPKEDK